MIISFNGDQGSGKSTIAKKVAEKLDYPRYYMGQVFRDMAQKKKITLVELLELCDKDPKTDKEVDQRLVDLSKRKNDFVVESRTAWHFIPTSLKIYLRVEEEESAKRIFKELKSNASRNNEDKGIDSIESIKLSERRRKERDQKRYERYYGINIHDEKNYDFVLDTTKLSVEQVFEKTLQFIESKMNA